MNRKTKLHLIRFSVVIFVCVLLVSWLNAQKAPPPPRVLPSSPKGTNAPLMTPQEADEMIQALRRAMRQSATNQTTTTPAGRPDRQAPGVTPQESPVPSAPGFQAAPVPSGQPGVPATTPGGPATTPGAPAQSPPVQPAGQPGATQSAPSAPGQAPVQLPAPGGAAAPGGQMPAVQPPVQPIPDETISAALIQVQGMPVDQFFEIYAMISGRTVLRQYELTGAPKGITLKAQTDWTREEAIFAMDAALALNGIAMIPVDRKFVKAVPAQEAPMQGADLSKLDPDNYAEAERFVTQVVELKVIKPSEIGQLLATFSKVPNSITPFDNNNTLVLREYASNVKRMMEVIKRVDVERESDYKLEVIPIRYGRVADLYNTMNALISGGGAAVSTTGGAPGAAGVGGAGIRQPTRSTGRLGGAGAYGSRSSGRYGSGYGGGGYPGGYGGGYGGGYYPQQAASPTPVGSAQSSFQNRLQQIVSRAAQGPEVQLLEDARIVPDERSNTLLIFASKRDMEMITNIVAKVDVLLAQVLIEAIILEVKLNDSSNIGVSMLQQPRRFGDVSTVGGINNGQGFLSGVTNIAGSLPSGFSYFGKVSDQMDFAVTAIARDSDVKVTSRPRVQTSHGIPGEFVIAESVPFVTALSDYGFVGTGLTRSQVDFLPIGVQLYVTPYITPDGYVVMDISQSFDQRGADVVIDGNPYPVVNNRTTTSTLTVRDGDTIMMGGFITDNKNRSKSGVPGLKDIPLLGALFRSKSTSTDRTELIVLMRAKVLENPKDAAMMAAEEQSQLFGVQQAEQEFKEDDRKRRRTFERGAKR